MKITLTALATLGVAFASTLACAAEPDAASLYQVSTEGSTSKLKAGERGKLVISIEAKGEAHVSDEAPLRIELKSKDAKLEKEKLTLADSLTKRAPNGEYPSPKFEVAFTPSAQGKTSVEAKMTFFICTAKLCMRQTKDLVLPVEVN